MKKILSVNNTGNATSVGLLIARTGIAALMLTHGIPKLDMLLSGEFANFPPVAGMSAELSLALAVLAEVFCSIFILAGFATRLAVVPLIITMSVAVLIIHAADPIAMKQPALHYLLLYVVLLFTGSGKYSIDSLLESRRVTNKNRIEEVQDPTLAIYQ